LHSFYFSSLLPTCTSASALADRLAYFMTYFCLLSLNTVSTFRSTRPRPPLGHVVVTSKQWMHSQSTQTTRAGLRDPIRGRAWSVSVHYRRQ